MWWLCVQDCGCRVRYPRRRGSHVQVSLLLHPSRVVLLRVRLVCVIACPLCMQTPPSPHASSPLGRRTFVTGATASIRRCRPWLRRVRCRRALLAPRGWRLWVRAPLASNTPLQALSTSWGAQRARERTRDVSRARCGDPHRNNLSSHGASRPRVTRV